MWTSRTAFQICRGIALLGLLTAVPAQAQQAESAQPAAKPAAQPYGGGTPLDVIMHTKFWVDPPKMAPFVKASRPPAETLHYTPTAGKEPKRPPLRNAAQLQQMEDELENAGAHNEAVAHEKVRHFQAVRIKKMKKPAAASQTRGALIARGEHRS
jgi:hypothetical protein